MVTLTAYLPVSALGEDEHNLTAHLDPDESIRLEQIFDKLTNLLAPLARVDSEAALGELLRSTKPRFFSLKSSLLEMLWPYFSNIEESARLYEMLRNLARSKSDMLGEHMLSVLLDTVDSLEGFNEWVIGSMQTAKDALYTVDSMVQQVGEPIQYADICVNTLFLVLSEQLADWEPSAVPILATAADEYMTLVEDVFLSRVGDSESDGQTVDYDSLKQDLGL